MTILLTRIGARPIVAIMAVTYRMVFEIDESLHRVVMAEVAARSSSVRKATVAEVLRSFIAEHAEVPIER